MATHLKVKLKCDPWALAGKMGEKAPLGVRGPAEDSPNNPRLSTGPSEASLVLTGRPQG